VRLPFPTKKKGAGKKRAPKGDVKSGGGGGCALQGKGKWKALIGKKRSMKGGLEGGKVITLGAKGVKKGG